MEEIDPTSPVGKFWRFVTSHKHTKFLTIAITLIILAAVPLTVIVSQQQQQTKQNAATCTPTGSDPQKNGCYFNSDCCSGNCNYKTSTCAAAGTSCNPTDGKCTIPKDCCSNICIGGRCQKSCTQMGGKCLDTREYTCNSQYGFQANHCSGGTAIQCCTGSYKRKDTTAVVNGGCGSNIRPTTNPYSSTTKEWPGDKPTDFCSTGTPSPTKPTFPATGSSVSWTCNGSNGGTSKTCTAYRAGARLCGNDTEVHRWTWGTSGEVLEECNSDCSSKYGGSYCVSVEVNNESDDAVCCKKATATSTPTPTPKPASCSFNGVQYVAGRTLNAYPGSSPACGTKCLDYGKTYTCTNVSGVGIWSPSVPISATCSEPTGCGSTPTTPTSAKCGTAARTYYSNDTTFSGSFCTSGSPDIVGAFPAIGNSTTWHCYSSSGASITCTAKRISSANPCPGGDCSSSACVKQYGGTCQYTSEPCTYGQFYQGLCPGSSSFQCCVTSGGAIPGCGMNTYTSSTCNGACAGSSFSKCTAVKSSTGATYYKCCNPTTYNDPCANGACTSSKCVTELKGNCQWSTTSCNGQYKTGYCPGPSNFQCCVPGEKCSAPKTDPYVVCENRTCKVKAGCGLSTGGCTREGQDCGSTNPPVNPPTNPTNTPTTNPGAIMLALNVGLDGIGAAGDHPLPCTSLNTCASNKNPVKKIKDVEVSVLDSSNTNKTPGLKTTLTYDSTTGTYKGTVPVNVSTGQYTIKVKPNGLLAKKLVSIQNLVSGTNQIPSASITTGDIDNDNNLTVLDYNILISCSQLSRDNKTTCNKSSNYTEFSDLTNDGKIDLIDYNLFLREYSVQNGD